MQQRLSQEAMRSKRSAVAEAVVSSIESPLTSMVNAVLSNRLIVYHTGHTTMMFVSSFFV